MSDVFEEDLIHPDISNIPDVTNILKKSEEVA